MFAERKLANGGSIGCHGDHRLRPPGSIPAVPGRYADDERSKAAHECKRRENSKDQLHSTAFRDVVKVRLSWRLIKLAGAAPPNAVPPQPRQVQGHSR